MSGEITESTTSGRRRPTQRIQRIETLLQELEVLSHNANEMPLPLVLRALTTIDKARSALKLCVDGANQAQDDDDDPQPDVDAEIMERMYRSFGSGRRER